ncbi:hypothetical protein [Bartonella taylorii]|uniref:hypothetical protein n=1 Tax=Bartonella taylorii TaxID=33046 RepID=UPI001ABB45BC|nr:hypothetical protein [Bartonella taylorii]
MFKNHTLYILMTAIFCFSQIVEVHANLWRTRSQEGIFIAIVAQEKDTLVQTKKIFVIGSSGQNARERGRSINGKKVDKIIFTAIILFLGRLAFKAVGVLKRWAGAALSQAFEDWRDSLYH